MKPQTEILETCFDMWWDVMCGDFWDACESSRGLPQFEEALNYVDLHESEKIILDTIVDTLVRISELNDNNCKEYALHGIGHSRHPKRATIVQAIIDSTSFTEDYLPWLESCKDGTVL